MSPIDSPLPGAPPFRLTSDDESGALVVRVEGELDLATAPRLIDALGEARARESAVPLVLDLERVTFMDSTGVRSLLEVERMRRDTGRPVALLSPSAAVTRVLDLVELRSTFVEIADLGPESIARVAQPAG